MHGDFYDNAPFIDIVKTIQAKGREYPKNSFYNLF